MHRYKTFNSAMATTAVTTKVATGTAAIKTMLQVATPSNRQLQVISWGFSLDVQGGLSTIELIQTDVAATVTAHVAAGIQPLDPNAQGSLCVGGTAATGFTASVEGTTTASRVFDALVLTATAANPLVYSYQFMPDERPIVAQAKFLRVRCNTTTAANMLCWITWDE